MDDKLGKVQAIDPPSCGCPECLTGEYLPRDSPVLPEVLEAALASRIPPLRNNTNETMIVYRDNNGAAQYHTDSSLSQYSDYLLVPAHTTYESATDQLDVSGLHSCNQEDKQAATANHVKEVVEGKRRAANPTSTTYLIYVTPYKEVGALPLHGYSTGNPFMVLYNN